MPRTRSLAWSELKIGVLTIAAIVIAAVLIFMLTGSKGFFWQRYSLKTRFPNVAGLERRVAGAGGRRRGRQRQGGRASSASRSTSIFEVNKDHRAPDHRRVGRHARVGLAARRSAVDITPSTTGTPIPDGATCRRAGAGAVRRHRRPGQPGHRRAHRADQRRAPGQGHGRQADDRRPALHRAAAVRRVRRADDRASCSRAGARSASCSRTRRRPKASRRR